jgi:hypothetical protein
VTTAAPTRVNLAPGTYVVPGSAYQLVVSRPGVRLERSTLAPPLLDLVAPPTPDTPATPAPAAATMFYPSTWLLAAVVCLGTFGVVHVWQEQATPAPAEVASVTPVNPTPTPVTPVKRVKPEWLGDSPPHAASFPVSAPAHPPEWLALSWAPGWEGLGRNVSGVFRISTWRPIVQPVTYEAAPLQACPTGACPLRQMVIYTTR